MFTCKTCKTEAAPGSLAGLVCGIAGFLAKTPEARSRLGCSLATITAQVSHRGTDSAGFAIFAEAAPGEAAGSVTVEKRPGPAAALIEATALRGMSGSHGVAHTRMATESRVSAAHAHPFCPTPELALVHNGSLSNHNALRREMSGRGIGFDTDNDSEVAARFLADRLARGDSLEGALEEAVECLDGFFTFVVATPGCLAVVRDRIACKPALVAESEEWVAIASEPAAISALSGGQGADVWEPHPGRVYSWELAGALA